MGKKKSYMEEKLEFLYLSALLTASFLTGFAYQSTFAVLPDASVRVEASVFWNEMEFQVTEWSATKTVVMYNTVFDWQRFPTGLKFD